MPDMQTDIEALRARERTSLLPMEMVAGVRLTKLQHHRIQARALALQSSPSEVIRLLLEKGAEHYGFEISSVL